jgi:secreted trypsin-like serine protease
VHRSRTLLAWMAGLIAISASCGDCTGGKSKAPQAKSTATSGETDGVPDGSVSVLAQQAVSSPEMQGSLLIGEADETNRYPSTVAVYALAPRGQPRYRACAGVLLTPQLVLTAGQCVCRPHADSRSGIGATTRIDSSDCAREATVVTSTYEPLTHRKGVESWAVEYQGTIRLHPQFELLLDDQGTVTVDHADLAVVRLDTPVQENIPPVRLSKQQAQLGERLTVVGYGYIEAIGGMDGRRRFSRETVVQFLDPNGTRVLFGSPELHAYKGDTGGPCLRESEQGLELVGISSRGLGKEPTFTSTYRYRDWLDEEIHLAEREGLKP